MGPYSALASKYMYMANPITTHSMKTNNPWNDYSRTLFYEASAIT